MLIDNEKESIVSEEFEYNNKDKDEIILENEKEQLHTDSHFDSEGVYPMKTIKVDKGFFTAYELKRKYDKKPSLVVLDSDFQRKSVWSTQQKRELIESVIMGLPLPIFYFNEDKKGRLIVIDGRQRLTALFEFMDNVFSLDKLKILDEFNKCKFKNLDPILQSKIEDYQIMAHVIQPPTPDRIKFDIFDRVNRAGTQLNKQEIRNALYQGNATKLLNELSDSISFSEATEYAFEKDKRMKDRYLLLRFISFYLYFNKRIFMVENNGKSLYQYSGDVDEFLGLVMEILNNYSENEIEDIKQLTLKALEQVNFYLGKNAFRLTETLDDGTVKRFPININIFETVMYGMTLLPFKCESIKLLVKQFIDEMKNSNEFRDSLYNHRDSDTKVIARYNMMVNIVGGIANDKQN